MARIIIKSGTSFLKRTNIKYGVHAALRKKRIRLIHAPLSLSKDLDYFVTRDPTKGRLPEPVMRFLSNSVWYKPTCTKYNRKGYTRSSPRKVAADYNLRPDSFGWRRKRAMSKET